MTYVPYMSYTTYRLKKSEMQKQSKVQNEGIRKDEKTPNSVVERAAGRDAAYQKMTEW